MKDFRTLKVWEKSHALVLAIYEATSLFPKQELCALTKYNAPRFRFPQI